VAKVPALILVLTVCTFTGCVTGEKMHRLHQGMTPAEVVAILGQPDGFSRSAHQETYRYSNRLATGWAYDRADYNVIFHNGRVSEYGAGQVRPKQQQGPIVILGL
jgi:outer membrane protein assembly factor BamE (lipoprotein component of BamABCDE complex)